MARSINDPNERILPKNNQDYFRNRDRYYMDRREADMPCEMGYMSMVEREEIKKIGGKHENNLGDNYCSMFGVRGV